MNKKIINKVFAVAVTCLTVTVMSLGEYSVDKGLIAFARGKTSGNIVNGIQISSMSLASFSSVPDVKRSIIFVEEKVANENKVSDEFSVMSVSTDAVADVEVKSDTSKEDKAETDILEEYGISADSDVTIGDIVGVGSEVTAVVKSSVSTNDYEELLRVRKSASQLDKDYKGKAVSITGHNRELLERLVQGESGGEGYIGACLVAQTIRDTMVMDNKYDVMTIKRGHGYSAKLVTAPNQSVKDAVAFIFDEGGYVVQHRLVYFYSPKNVSSSFHESQLFLVEYGGHRFFDRIRR